MSRLERSCFHTEPPIAIIIGMPNYSVRRRKPLRKIARLFFSCEYRLRANKYQSTNQISLFGFGSSFGTFFGFKGHANLIPRCQFPTLPFSWREMSLLPRFPLFCRWPHPKWHACQVVEHAEHDTIQRKGLSLISSRDAHWRPPN